jgi:predicted MFS family arabinose efflux permease
MSGDWVLIIALPISVLQMTGSTAAVSGVVIAGMLPMVALGSVAGVFVDRWDRRRTMVATSVLQAAAVAPLLLLSADRLWIAYLVAFAESTVAQFFSPAEGALLPRLVSDDQLVAANSLNALNNNLARLAGPAAGGLLTAAFGLTGVVLVDCASFLAAAALLLAIRGNHRAVTTAEPLPEAGLLRWWREWLAGLALVRKDPVLRILFTFAAVTAVGEGVFGVLIVVFVRRVLDGGALELGWLMSAQAVGGIIGGLIGTRLRPGSDPAKLIGVGMIVFGLIDLAIFNYPAIYPGFWPAIVLFVAVGIPGVIAGSLLLSTLQRAVIDQFRGRVLGSLNTNMALLGIIGSASAGLLADPLGVVAVLNVQGFAYVGAGLMLLVTLRAALARTAERAPA